MHPLAAYPTAALALWLLRRTLGPYVRVLVVIVAALSGWRGAHAMGHFLEQRASLRSAIGAAARCSGDGTVAESPILRGGRTVAIVDSDHLECDLPIDGKPRLRLIGTSGDLARGDRITFVAQIGPVAPLRQLELGDPIPRAAALGVLASGGVLAAERVECGHGWRHVVDRARAWVRRRIQATYTPKAEALGRALVLGESDLDPDEQLAFQRSGLSHLLAVSGTHLVFAVVSVVAALRAVLLRVRWLTTRLDVSRWVAPVGAVLALLYADFAGGSGSAWRAAWMLSAVYMARLADRRLGGLRALAFSIIIGVVYDPLANYDVSLLLSALATAGLVVIGPTLKSPLTAIPWAPVRWLTEALATTCSAMIPCTPLLLLLAPDLTLAGLAANVIAGPIGELAALPLCLIHTLLAPVPAAELGFAVAGSGALIAVGFIAKASAAVTWARIALPPPTVEQFAVMGLGILAAMTLAAQPSRANGASARTPWLHERGPQLILWAILTIGCLIGLELAAIRAGAPRGVLRVTALDVGQGDSLLVDLPDGRLMLVDGGGAITGGPDPGQRILLPTLRARRRRYLDIAVLTHPHPDHFGGLLTALRSVPVREFWEVGALDDEERRSDSDLARLRRDLVANGTRIRHLPDLCSAYASHLKATIQVLGPCPNAVREHHANDQSLVIRLAWGRHSALLQGDAEALEESEILAAQGQFVRADLLKLGHHGSRTSTSPAWLDAVRPSMGIASVGWRNRFGHPHAATLSRLAAAHVPLFRTDELGSIEWLSDGVNVSVRTATTGSAHR